MSQCIVGQSVWLELVGIGTSIAQAHSRGVAAWLLERSALRSSTTIITTAPAGAQHDLSGFRQVYGGVHGITDYSRWERNKAADLPERQHYGTKNLDMPRCCRATQPSRTLHGS